ncbi:hypothetical protein KPP03845_107432 [Streptomyces xanthophaeus]|nr:hypothetical protein KPP03845_107432 [Streptomyces xanthophaeus]
MRHSTFGRYRGPGGHRYTEAEHQRCWLLAKRITLCRRPDDRYRGGETSLEEPVSAQPEHTPIPSYAPGAPAELLAQLRADQRAPQWVPAFERE